MELSKNLMALVEKFISVMVTVGFMLIMRMEEVKEGLGEYWFVTFIIGLVIILPVMLWAFVRSRTLKVSDPKFLKN